MKLKEIFWFNLILILLIGGCQLFSPPNVETVVMETSIKYWNLSPNGDYIIYGTSRGEGNFLLNLATGQEHEFDCRLQWWDNSYFDCYRKTHLSVIDIQSLTETPLSSIDLATFPTINVEMLLAEAKLIYRPEWVTDTVYILAEDYQLNPNKNYVITGLINPDEILNQYAYIPVPRSYPKSSASPVNAPNNLYYYEFTAEGFGIFTTDKNELVAEFTDQGASYLEIGGWEVDSSGVYFSTFQGGFGGSGVRKEIRKLTIPDE